MGTILASLVPVILLIALGAGLRRIGFMAETFWPQLERFVYFLLFPPLLFHTIATAHLDGSTALRLAGVFALAVAIMGTLLMLLKPMLPISGPAFTSVFQGAIRWNSFVALGILAALLGTSGVALAAVAFATLVPLVNMLSVLVLSRYAADKPASAAMVAKSLAQNPLIIACLLGIAASMSGLTLPDPVLKTLKLMGDASIAIGLVSVGSALDFRALTGSRTAIVVTTLLKLAVMPLIMAAACWIMGVSGEARMVALICASVPGATSSYILARQLGGDATLMANLITVSTIGAGFTMPLVIALAQ